jgi:hypothetical protein
MTGCQACHYRAVRYGHFVVPRVSDRLTADARKQTVAVYTLFYQMNEFKALHC